MSYQDSSDDSQYSNRRSFSLSNKRSPAPSPSRHDSPVEYDSYRNYQAKRPNKRRRASEDANETHELEPPRKIRNAEEIWKEESARYGIIPAAGRRAIREIENALRGTAVLSILQIETIRQAVRDRVSRETKTELPIPDNPQKGSQLNRGEDSDFSASSPSPPNTSESSSETSLSPSPKPVGSIRECPACTFRQPAIAISCEICDTTLLCQFIPLPPLPTPRSHAIAVMQHDTYPDYLKGAVLVEYRRAHSPASEGDMELCTGAGGPAGTIDENGNPFEITDEERESLVEEKNAIEAATAQRSSHYSQLQHHAMKNGLPVPETQPYFDGFIVLN